MMSYISNTTVKSRTNLFWKSAHARYRSVYLLKNSCDSPFSYLEGGSGSRRRQERGVCRVNILIGPVLPRLGCRFAYSWREQTSNVTFSPEIHLRVINIYLTRSSVSLHVWRQTFTMSTDFIEQTSSATTITAIAVEPPSRTPTTNIQAKSSRQRFKPQLSCSFCRTRK